MLLSTGFVAFNKDGNCQNGQFENEAETFMFADLGTTGGLKRNVEHSMC